MRAPARTIGRARRLRRTMTLPEVILWQHLRLGLAGLRFRRQHPIGAYVLDFYCPAAKLAIEVDGFSHDTPERIRHDDARAAWLNERHIQVLRIPARHVLDPAQLPLVLEAIASAVTPSTA